VAKQIDYKYGTFWTRRTLSSKTEIERTHLIKSPITKKFENDQCLGKKG